MDYRLTPEEMIEDGFGSVSPAYCSVCGRKSMYVCRPGDIRCAICYDGNPEGMYKQKPFDGCEDAREKIERMAGQLKKFRPCISKDESCAKHKFWGGECDLPEDTDKCPYMIREAKQILQEVLIPEIEKAKKEERERIMGLLGLTENELGFCEISNHVPYKDWQSPSGVEE